MLIVLAKILGLAAAYFITGKLGVLFALPPGYATAIWAPSGIALAGILLFGYGVWPGVWLGSCIVNLSTTLHSLGSASVMSSILVVGCIGMGASLQALLGAYLIRRFVGFPSLLEEENEIVSFLVLGGPVSCVVSATVGVITLSSVGVVPLTNLLMNWWTWWIGDTIGVILVTPLLLIAITHSAPIWSRRQISVIFLLGFTFLVVVALFIFSNNREKAQIDLEFRRRVSILFRSVQFRLENYLEILRVLGSFIQTNPNMDVQEFRRFITGAFGEMPGMDALVWELGSDSVHGKSMVPLYGKPESLNFLSSSIYRRAEQEARETGSPTISDPIYPSTNQLQLLVCYPVYQHGLPHDTIEERKKALFGTIVGVIQVDAAIGAAFEGLDQEGINLRIFDESDVTSEHLLYARRELSQGTSVLHAGERNPASVMGVVHDHVFSFANRPLRFQFFETQEYLIANRSLYAWLVLLCGLLFTGLLGAFLLVVTRRASKVENLVVQRTASLEASESRFRSMMESAQEMIMICDPTGTILSCNPACEKSFGYAEKELIGKSLSNIISARDERVKLEVKQQGWSSLVGRVVELIGNKKEGSQVALELSMATWEAERESYFGAFLRDITERKKIDQMKNDFVSFASHQLKTPLAEIHGLVENMLGGLVGEFTEKQRLYLYIIRNSAQQNLHVVSDLLSVSKMEQGMISMETKPVELDTIAWQALKSYQEMMKTKGLQLNFEFPEKSIQVMADFGKAVEAIKNVIDNAVKFTEQGSISVRVSVRAGRGIVEISDTGSGIDATMLPSLFTKDIVFRDSTNAKGGSGLGLYIAKSFMKLQGGDLWAESLPKWGSKFTFIFQLVGTSSATDTP